MWRFCFFFLSFDGKKISSLQCWKLSFGSFFFPDYSTLSRSCNLFFWLCCSLKRKERQYREVWSLKIFTVWFIHSVCVNALILSCRQGEIASMYERHRRRYSFCAKGERTVDVVLIKVGGCVCMCMCVTIQTIQIKDWCLNISTSQWCWSMQSFRRLNLNISDPYEKVFNTPKVFLNEK